MKRELGTAPTLVSPFRLLRVDGKATSGNPDIAVMQEFRCADRELGGGHLYSEVIAYLHSDLGPRLFAGDHGSSAAIFIAAAGLTEMAGWMAHDAGHDQRAYHHFCRARDLSELGRDRQLEVHVLASLSHLALHRDKPTEAIRHAHDAEIALSKAPGNPGLKARIYAMQARSFAALHRPRDAHRLLDRAVAALTDSGPIHASPWVSHFDHGSLASEAARCWRELGDLARAGQHAQQIIDLRPPGRTRSRAFGQLTLAAIITEQGHPERACTIATEAIGTTGSLGSYLVVRHLSDLQGRLQRYRGVPSVTEFLDYLGEEMRERTWIQRWPPTNPTGRQLRPQ
ncbi:hypothetical protein OG203_03245 [Nocardia sp. NBC_01499]|uniref:hypothetical protein n=1 Tax=Nocardia sp. NBC_01499 TaxID=2903597 RepID=UPI003866D2D7